MEIPITPKAVKETEDLIRPYVLQTPVVAWYGAEIQSIVPSGTTVLAKLEMFQRSGTFKARGALSNILRLEHGALKNGVVAASAGNHAVAVAYAAAAAGTSAKVVMQKSANPARIDLARSFGAEVLLADDGASAFESVEEIVKTEGRSPIHPFDGIRTALGTATLGAEFLRQAGNLDVLIVAVGGGGLAGGVATITKILNPRCIVVGVEPQGADSMNRSFQSGRAESIDVPQTIADSLAPPMTLPLPLELCRNSIDRLVVISDAEMASAMRLIFRELKLAVEPACAASTAGLRRVSGDYPGARIGLILCGSNIDFDTYSKNSNIR